eukprot:5034002-Amphidinium_carterae.1
MACIQTSWARTLMEALRSEAGSGAAWQLLHSALRATHTLNLLMQFKDIATFPFLFLSHIIIIAFLKEIRCQAKIVKKSVWNYG